MRIRVLMIFVAIVAMAAIGNAQDAYQQGQLSSSLKAATATGAGTSFAMPQMNGMYPTIFTWTNTFASGSPSGVTVNLEGSLDSTDGVNGHWFTLDSTTSTSGEMRHVVYKPVRFLRCNLSSYTASGATDTCQFVAGRL